MAQPFQLSSFVNMMKSSLSRYLAMTCILMLVWFNGAAQQEYFIFLQSDRQQPFYVRVGEKIYSSSAAGHLVVSGLRDSTYSLYIGFPKNQYPEMEFVIPVSKKDQGFQLKDMGDKGWNLFNFLTLQLLKPKSTAPKSTAYSPDVKKKTDNYSRLMAGVVNDTAVLYATFASSVSAEPVVKQTISIPDKEEKRAEPDTTVSGDKPATPLVAKNDTKRDSTTVANSQASTDANQKKDQVSELVVATPALPVRDTVLVKTETTTSKALDSTVNTKETVSVFRDSANRQNPVFAVVPAGQGISKIEEEKTNEGVQLTFVVKESGIADTVSVFINYTPPAAGTITPVQSKPVTAETKKQETNPSKTDSVSAAGKLVMINSDCRNFASDRDVDKLRIKILSEKKDIEKLDVVKKEYRTKCYTSRQVKALSELFYQDPLRFEFLSASFPFVSDSENFRQLVTLLRDPVYIEKFEGLFKN